MPLDDAVIDRRFMNHGVDVIADTYRKNGCALAAMLDVWSVIDTARLKSWSVTVRRAGKVWKSSASGRDLGGYADAVLRLADETWDTAEIVLSYAAQPRRSGRWLNRIGDQACGVEGLRLIVRGVESVWPPTRMIAENVDFEAAFKLGLTELGLSRDAFDALGGRLVVHEADCLLLSRKSRSASSSVRGRTSIADTGAGSGDVRMLASGMTDWLVRHVAANGRLTYLYEPNGHREPDRNNTIRQFMSTLCLGRAGRAFGRKDARRCAERNLRYNLKTFYRERGGLGIILFGGSAKLGAAALAAHCILDQTSRAGPYAVEFSGLLRGLEALWDEDGWFRTFHVPAQRVDNQNFYPGEALTFLTDYAGRHDRDLLPRIVRSVWRYRGFHLAERNPAFVPWHTQAAAALFDLTGDDKLAKWIFDMNDWLLPLQRRTAPCLDMIGSFHDPERPEFGPPHASSTGVYLEGLADAARVALKLGEIDRTRRYTEAARLGFRNLAQLQYRDEAEMFFVRRPDLARGGLRTNPWNSTIRVDNVQHALAAAMKWLPQASLLDAHASI